jgi:hypothetical protein
MVAPILAKNRSCWDGNLGREAMPTIGGTGGIGKQHLLQFFFISTILETWKQKMLSRLSPPWRTKPD